MTTLIARVAIAVMALHIIDDSFLQPARGTSFADHLVSGLLPLAALAAAAWAFPRLRPGARAVCALVLGPFGIALGTEAVYYWREVGLSGDDYTGLLAIPAGVLLLGVAAATLWTSRRLDDSRYWRYPRRLLLAGAGLLGLVWAIAPLSVSYGFTHITRAEVPVAKLGTPHENVTLRTRDGLDLTGWYVPSRNGAAVIVYPGRGSAQKHARYLSRHGYGVLLFDRRGEGASEGDPHAFGWSFDEDIKAGVAFLKQRADVDPGRIGGLGLSVGGEMMLQTAAGTKDLAAVVSDGAGARVVSEELADLKGFAKGFSAPLFLVKTAALAVFSNHAPPSDLTTYIPRIAPRPFLLIHAAKGEVDKKTPEYLAAARGPVEDWEVPKGGHTAGINTMPEEYARRVLGFFDRSLR
jgi:fermentation-respiration switch protein FrsA (DUF1100 family)